LDEGLRVSIEWYTEFLEEERVGGAAAQVAR
jgi:hypothetical protein